VYLVVSLDRDQLSGGDTLTLNISLCMPYKVDAGNVGRGIVSCIGYKYIGWIEFSDNWA